MRLFTTFFVLSFLALSCCGQSPSDLGNSDSSASSPAVVESPVKPVPSGTEGLTAAEMRLARRIYNKASGDSLRVGFKYAGEIVIPRVYQELPFPMREKMVAKKNDKYGIINANNEVVVPFVYDEKFGFLMSDLMVVKKDGKAGAIDRAGKTIVSFSYDRLLPHYDYEYGDVKPEAVPFAATLAAYRDGKAGLIDTAERVIIPFAYEEIYQVNFNRVLAYTGNGPYVIFDTAGKRIASIESENFPDPWAKRYLIFKQAGKYGVATLDGKTILPPDYPKFEQIAVGGGYRGGSRKVKGPDGLGAINLDLKTIVPLRFDRINGLPGGVLLVYDGDLMGAYRDDGTELIQAKMSNIRMINAQHLFAWNHETGSGTVIDTNGTVVLSDTPNGVIGAGNVIMTGVLTPGSRTTGRYMLNDANGQQIDDRVLEKISTYGFLFRAAESRDGKLALFDGEGKQLTDFIYDRLEFDWKAYAKKMPDYFRLRAARDGKWMAMDQYGKEREPMGAYDDPFGKPVKSVALPDKVPPKETAYTGLTKEQEVLQKKVGDMIAGFWYRQHKLDKLTILEELGVEESGKIRRTLSWKDDHNTRGETFRVYLSQPAGGDNRQSSVVSLQPLLDWRQTGSKTDGPSRQELSKLDLNRLEVKLNYGEDPVINNYSGSIDMGFDVFKESMRDELLRNLTAQAELKSTAEGSPGGLREPNFYIDLKSNELSTGTTIKDYPLGKIVFDEEGYYLEPTILQGARTGAVSGLIRSVRYRKADGNIARGDLQLELMNGGTMGLRPQ